MTRALISAVLIFWSTMSSADIGPETGLPMPRYVSMKVSEGNVRRGPSRAHRIDWVFVRRGMPLRVTAEYGHWRRVEDRDGMGGWVHYSLISGTRTVIVEQDMLALHSQPHTEATVKAHLELGVIARVSDCADNWCKVSTGGYRGWVPRDALWGVSE
ncbi:MAG: SH3 domain-containing protein [Pseudomonadota bacterium]